MALIKRETRDAFIPKPYIDKPIEDKECPRCRNTFTDNDALQRHMIRKHSDVEQEGIEREDFDNESDEDGSEFTDDE